MSRPGARPFPKCFLLMLIMLACPFAARALDLDVKLEPGAALSLNSQQNQRFQLGGAATLKGLVGFEGGYFNLAAGLTFLGLSSQTGYPNSSAGTAWAPSLGLRVQFPRESDAMRLGRPHARESYYGARPWLDADVLYVNTAGLDRVGFASAVGLSFPMGEARSFWLGPFVRYFAIFQGSPAGYDNRNANTIILGLSLETGTRLVSPAPKAEEKVASTVVAAVAARPDRDGDGLADDVDACPDMFGPASNAGCPVYEKIIVKAEALELKEKIQFAWNQAVIESVSYPSLDEVSKALRDNTGFRVAVEGHASSEGADDHKQPLSTRRADAVLDYIADHGVARDRLASKGFSSSRPIESNATESGREANRRVEFVVSFIVLKEGSLQ